MTRDEIIEVMARASWDEIWQDKYESLSFESQNIAKDGAVAALKALEQAGYVVVPREATDAMIEAGQKEVNLCEESGKYEFLSREEIRRILAAMLTAHEGEIKHLSPPIAKRGSRWKPHYLSH